MIFLFESTDIEFDNGGLGSLSDVVVCAVEEERNGKFELTMQYPVDGRHYEDLQLRRIILSKPNPFDDPEPFRIYAISKPLNGIVTVNAAHISYDLSDIPVRPFSVNSVQLAFMGLKNNAVVSCPFTFETYKDTSGTFEVKKPTSIRSLLGGTEGSILDVFGKGEYQFQKFKVTLWVNRGNNNGVTIRYGKNLTDINQEENCSNVYTAVFPYWYSDEDGLITLDDYLVDVPGTFNYVKVLPLDLSDKFQEPPTDPNALLEATNAYIENNNLGVPKVNLKVSFVQLAQSEEYKQYQLLETVRLCDTVNVEFPKLGVSATSKCIKTTYNVITNKYTSIELGESTTNLAETISEQSVTINKVVPPDSNVFKRAVDNATKLITGGLGGYVMLHSSTGGDIPDEILILGDSPDYTQANKIWRWNKDGLGYSSSGYNGPFALAMTSDGHFVANFITAGTMEAIHIKGGLLSDDTGKNYWNLSTGEFQLSWNAKIGTESNYIELKDLGSFRLETPFEWSGTGTSTRATFQAHLYQNDEDVTANYNSRWFTWYLRNEEVDKSIARGKGVAVYARDLAYVGTITCLFRTFETRNLLTESGKQFLTPTGKNMTIWVEE